MNRVLKLVILISFISISLSAENNSSIETNITVIDTNITTIEQNSTVTREEITKKHLAEQIAKEKKFAKEQKFYQGDEYDLSTHEIDEKSLDSINVIEPEYDFSMDHVYD